MHKRRLNHLLAGAAVTAVLALTISGNSVFAQSNQPILASVPASEAASQAAPAAAQAAPQSEAEKPAPAAETPAAPAPSKETTGNVQYKIASAEVDAQIADKLRELSSGKFDRLFGGRKERASIEAFYSERNFAPLWITNGAVNPRGNAATDYLAHVDEHGLEPSDYPTPAIQGWQRDRRAGRSRAQADPVGHHLRAPRPDRPRPLFAHRLRHPVRAGAARARRRPEEDRGVDQHGRRARQLPSAARRLQGAPGQARRGSQDARGRSAAHPRRDHAEVQQGQEGQRGPDGGSSGAGAARQASAPKATPRARSTTRRWPTR